MGSFSGTCRCLDLDVFPGCSPRKDSRLFPLGSTQCSSDQWQGAANPGELPGCEHWGPGPHPAPHSLGPRVLERWAVASQDPTVSRVPGLEGWQHPLCWVTADRPHRPGGSHPKASSAPWPP